jgi:hypothetical protein
MKLNQLFLCVIAFAVPLTLNAATEKSKDRWFEIEVILFNQLGDKSLLKETFAEHNELPKYRRVIDLLGPYLNPDINSLKQLLPNCESPQYPDNLVKQNAKLPSLFIEKSLAEMALAPMLLAPMATPENLATDNGNIPNSSDGSSFSDDSNFRDNTGLTNENSLNQTRSLTLTNNDLAQTTNDASDLDIDEFSQVNQGLTAKQKALIDAAEEKFQTLAFDYTPQAQPKILCRIAEEKFAEYQLATPDFDYNGFSVDKMPLQINAAEDPMSNDTHLLNKASLKLTDIVTDLKYSKNFRPLLHLGWRQVARAKNKATAVKIYAGDNLDAHYQQQVNLINERQAQLDEEPLALSAEEKAQRQASLNESTIAIEQQILLAKQQRIDEITKQIDNLPTDTNALLQIIDDEETKPAAFSLTTQSNSSLQLPAPPVQQWFLDGLFNVHLKHYLFITADFNVLDNTLAELATKRLAAEARQNAKVTDGNELGKATQSLAITAKPIRFKQNKRVISGEVHYFDHPYIGMIVQIRPYKRPVPEAIEDGSN